MTAGPRVAITVGDPRGVGRELIANILDDPPVQATYVVIGPDDLLERLGPCETIGVGVFGDGGQARAGELSGAAIERATEMAMRRSVDAIVTAPISKEALLAGGYDTPGHTELLARLTGSSVAMMLASDRLRVVLATTHIPLSKVIAALTEAVVVRTVEITAAGLRELYGIASPRIALCGLNPHLGEGGAIGDEDQLVLKPAARGCGAHGPFPADTVFVRAMKGEFDAVVAPYHDVGMTAIKVASFGSAINVTLGLPFVRTSPDHGTAFDIAGKDMADPTSMRLAVTEAVRLSTRHYTGRAS